MYNNRLSQIVYVLLVLPQIHLHLLLLLRHLLLRHIAYQLVHVLILDLLVVPLHYVLHVLVHHIHALLLRHEALHGFLVVVVLHLAVGAAHDLGHAGHHVGHGVVDAHLLQFEVDSLELSIQFVVLGDHLVIPQNLVGDHFLALLNRDGITTGYFFSIFFLRSFCNCFPWKSIFIFYRWYSLRIPLTSFVYYLTCSE